MPGTATSIPTVGTIGHAFILAHRSEREAFEAPTCPARCGHHLPGRHLRHGLRDRNRDRCCRGRYRAIRLDSGDLAAEAERARVVLDRNGETEAKIVVSGDLDEWKIEDLAPAPIDGYLIGTSLVTGSGHPTASLVYKLVAVDLGEGLQSVAKQSAGKPTTGGRKAAFRQAGDDNLITNDLLLVDNEHPIGAVGGPGRRLQVPLIQRGRRVGQPSLESSRAWSQTCRAELPIDARGPDSTREFASVVEAVNP